MISMFFINTIFSAISSLDKLRYGCLKSFCIYHMQGAIYELPPAFTSSNFKRTALFQVCNRNQNIKQQSYITYIYMSIRKVSASVNWDTDGRRKIIEKYNLLEESD